MILNRYIIREISRPMFLICAILVAVFTSYFAAGYLSDAVMGSLSLDSVLMMIFLKISIAQEILLPATLYLAVVIALGRMYRDSEVVALQSCGVADLNIVKPVVYFSLIIAAAVSMVSFYVRPWAYGKLYWYKTHAQSNFDLSHMESGNFYEVESAGLVVFAEKIDQDKPQGHRVFIHGEEGDTLQVILADTANQVADPSGGEKILMLQNGYIYEIDRSGEKNRVTEFHNARYVITSKDDIPQRYRRKAASNRHLLSSENLEDIAELQWRLFTPMSALLLGLLGVLLSRTTPRQGKYGKVITAMMVFAIYYNLSVVVKNMVENGKIGPYLGMGWLQLALATLIGILSWHQGIIRFPRSAT